MFFITEVNRHRVEQPNKRFGFAFLLDLDHAAREIAFVQILNFYRVLYFMCLMLIRGFADRELDFAAAGKISGARFSLLKGNLARLHRAIT